MNVTYPASKKSQKANGIAPFLVALVLLGAIALGAFIASSGGESTSGPGAVAAQTVPQLTRSTAIQVLYIVDSQEQEDMVWAGEAMAAMERASAGIPEPDQYITVMRVTTPAQELDANDIVVSWTEAGHDYRVFDYRGR